MAKKIFEVLASLTSKTVFKPKNEFQCSFGIKLSFKYPALATPYEFDRVMKDW